MLDAERVWSVWGAPVPLSALAEIIDGSYRRRNPPEIRGTGYVVRSTEAALWAFWHGRDFREGALLAANLGEDADTTAAIYGQLAGAFYGIEGIPAAWRATLHLHDEIVGYADRLFALSESQPFRLPAEGVEDRASF